METILTNYPGVKRIVRFRFSQSPRNCELNAASGQKVICPYNKVDVQFFGVPLLVSTTKVENNGEITEAKLTVRSSQDLPFLGWCYVAELEDGSSYMLGSDDRMPLVSRGSSSGVPDGEAKVKSYEITFKGAFAPIPCLI